MMDLVRGRSSPEPTFLDLSLQRVIPCPMPELRPLAACGISLCDRCAMEPATRIRATLANGPDLGFLSRDGGIRTHDLSVPKDVGPFFGVLIWTNYQVRAYERTGLDPSDCGRTRDKRGMEGAKSDAISAHPSCVVLTYDGLDGCPSSHTLSECRQWLTSRSIWPKPASRPSR